MRSGKAIEFDRKVSLDGELVTLRPVTVQDVPALHTALADPEVSRLTGAVHSHKDALSEHFSLSELEEIYARWSTAKDRLVWVIVDKSIGDIVGESVLNELDAGNQSCSFRIWISAARGRGLGTEATRLTVQHAFDRGMNRVELEVYAFNPRARHVYEKVGFIHEGVKRQALFFEDGWIDAHMMSCLAADWPLGARQQPEQRRRDPD